jgi:splicing factor 3A subunit 3
VEQYEDLPGLRPRELALLSAPPPGEDDLAEFYVRFSKVKDFHRRNTGINTRQFVNDLDEMVKGDGLQTIYVDEETEPMIVEPLDSVFSGEEGYGKHLDLYLSHTQYLNLKGASRLSYVGYLDMLRHGKVERTLDVKEKSVPAYLEYVQTLYNYIVSFFDRALPLIDVHKQIADLEHQFELTWAVGQVEGWEPEASTSKSTGLNTEGIWCPFCQKNYSKQTVYDAHLKSDKHKKKEKENKPVSDPSKANGSSAPAASASSSTSSRDKLRPPARLTYLIQALLKTDPIPERLSNTRNETERKMALTAREREQEMEEQDEAPAPVEITEEEEDDDDDGKIYNPLKLPLGWDGKPIPFWLYKLHGLGVTFSCEIW